MLQPWNIELHLITSSGKTIYLQIADTAIKDIYSGRLKGDDHEMTENQGYFRWK